MDKKNTIIGVLLLLASFYFMFDYSKKEAEAARYAQSVAAAQKAAKAPGKEAPAPLQKLATADLSDNAPETFAWLENDSIKAKLTSKGGAIEEVELLKYPESEDSKLPYTFNAVRNSIAAMTIGFVDEDSYLPKPLRKSFKLVKSSPNEVVYEYEDKGKYSIRRTYTVAKDEKDGGNFRPYTIGVRTTVKNLSKEPLKLSQISLYLGAVPPTESDVYGTNLSYVLYNSDEDTSFVRSSEFLDSSGFLGIGASRAKESHSFKESAKWASIKNQFFAAVFTPYESLASGGVAFPVTMEAAAEKASGGDGKSVANVKRSNKYMKNAIGGFIEFNVPVIAAGSEWTLKGDYYVGPKELDRLYSIGGGQEEIMNYGWFGFVSRPLSRLLNWIYSMVSVVSPEWGWGWSIIILTLLVRLVLWPLTSIQIKSSQRMAKMQEPLKEIRQKYKDDNKRIQQETMKLYSEYGINPLAGCLPVLIQIPIFIGLYYMLQTSCEIRFARFLWISDLSLPDTIAAFPSVFGIPLHILPLLNALVTFIQMHLTPMPSTDKTQAMMFKLMPVIMLLFFYTFPSGLVLYWLVQSLLGIVQAIIIRRGKDKVVLKKRTKPSFMQRMQQAMEEAQAQQQARGPEFDKLPLSQRLKIAREDAIKARKRMKERAMGAAPDRKKNPGGRSTKPKR